MIKSKKHCVKENMIYGTVQAGVYPLYGGEQSTQIW